MKERKAAQEDQARDGIAQRDENGRTSDLGLYESIELKEETLKTRKSRINGSTFNAKQNAVSKIKFRLIFVLCLISFLSNSAFSLMGPFYPLKAKEKGVELILPKDVACGDAFPADGKEVGFKVVPADAIEDGWLGLDNGPEATEEIKAALSDCAISNKSNRSSKSAMFYAPVLMTRGFAVATDTESPNLGLS